MDQNHLDNAHQLLGAALRSRRVELRLTHIEAAELAGCNPRFILEAEKGKPTIRLETLLRLMTTLGLQFRLENGRQGITNANELGS